MNATDSFILINDLMKVATEMWAGYVLWVGDPEEARLQLRSDEEVSLWLTASP